MVFLFYVKLSIYPLAVNCSSGPFHTRQFAGKLSVADVYESRHNKAAHMLKAGSSVGSLGVEAQGRFFCFLLADDSGGMHHILY